jgi:TetR/AcrR family transcriptional regulator, mexJK operon transcriptional repressor
VTERGGDARRVSSPVAGRLPGEDDNKHCGTADRSSERSAIIRLMRAEVPHFPALRAVQMRPRSITGAIAERLIVLDARGLLEVPDPEEAADQLFALTMGQMNNRSLFGALSLSDEDITRMATSGARAFLRAYRPG